MSDLFIDEENKVIKLGLVRRIMPNPYGRFNILAIGIALLISPILGQSTELQEKLMKPHILPDPIPREWVYLSQIAIGDTLVESVPDTIAILVNGPVELEPLRYQRHLGYSISDTSQQILGQAWKVWFPSRPYERILFETGDGLFIAFGNTMDSSIKFLTSDPHVGQVWGASMDTWFQIVNIDSQSFGDKKYKVVEVCRSGPGQTSYRERYKWAIGLGLLHWTEPAMTFHPEEGLIRDPIREVRYSLFAMVPQFRP